MKRWWLMSALLLIAASLACGRGTVATPAPIEISTPVPPDEESEEEEPDIEPGTCNLHADSAITVRTCPNDAYASLGTLPQDTTATVVGRTQDSYWWQIEFGGATGWAYTGSATMLGDCSQENVPVVECEGGVAAGGGQAPSGGGEAPSGGEGEPEPEGGEGEPEPEGGPTCGDGVCNAEHDESCETCEPDCGPCDEGPPPCGDGVCDPAGGEDCATCQQDCGNCCGDGVCRAEHDEYCGTCEPDCGECISGPVSDGGGEADAAGPVCGNGVVEAGEECDPPGVWPCSWDINGTYYCLDNCTCP